MPSLLLSWETWQMRASCSCSIRPTRIFLGRACRGGEKGRKEMRVWCGGLPSSSEGL